MINADLFLARIVEQEKITTVSFADLLCSSYVYGILLPFLQ